MKMLTKSAIREAVYRLKSTYSLKEVSIFGSYATGMATDKSDLDLLVEFEQPAVSLLKLNSLKIDLEDALGITVDVIHAPLPAGCMIRPSKIMRIL